MTTNTECAEPSMDTTTPLYSVVVPVYNRIDEVRDLLHSLTEQSFKYFEVIIVEDGSSEPCKQAVDEFADRLDIQYHYKKNEGRSIARNYGIEHSNAPYLVFFDSDCVIPPTYFATLHHELSKHPLDCFGGPDGAHESFTTTQKAISFAMTAFLTTGGIRGGKVGLEKFVPRSFNMGYSRKVYDTVGGFREMFSEDIDMSTRIRQAGFSTGLIHPAMVCHKRRVDFKKFWRQVHVFGMSRITLKLLYPGSLKPVHALPAVATLCLIALLLLATSVSSWWLLPIAIYACALFVSALVSTRSLKVSILAIPAAAVQLIGYGTGFLRAYTTKIILGHGRDIDQEIKMRKGK